MASMTVSKTVRLGSNPSTCANFKLIKFALLRVSYMDAYSMDSTRPFVLSETTLAKANDGKRNRLRNSLTTIGQSRASLISLWGW